jgi:hypothetical protein
MPGSSTTPSRKEIINNICVVLALKNKERLADSGRCILDVGPPVAATSSNPFSYRCSSCFMYNFLPLLVLLHPQNKGKLNTYHHTTKLLYTRWILQIEVT